MPDLPRVEFDTDMRLRCACGWAGSVTDIAEWDVNEDLNYVARVCPGCDTPAPEWGAFPGSDGVERIAKGSVADSLRGR